MTSEKLRNRYAKLENEKVIPVDDLSEWNKWFQYSLNERIVGEYYHADNRLLVSTVFLGIDHGFTMESSPLWFETMVFGGKRDGDMRRYETFDEAKKGHEEMVRSVKESMDEK